ncbi:MAG: hypothetical protein M3281_10110 [Chloroflexota bacterium]|nr:hypothetical protein [Chloroflexota bacterium]
MDVRSSHDLEPEDDLLRSVFGRIYEAQRFWHWAAVLAGLCAVITLVLTSGVALIGRASGWDVDNMESPSLDYLKVDWLLIILAYPFVVGGGVVLGLVALANERVRRGEQRGRAVAGASVAVCFLACLACTLISWLLALTTPAG